MNAENIKQLGLGVVSAGILLLVMSAILAYLFPNSTVPNSADLPTLLSIVWQRLVITISMAIFGLVATIAGTTLYGFGRLIEEVTYLQPIEETPVK
jgi:hypothetical protein